MDAYEAILSLRAVRHFMDEPLSEETIERFLKPPAGQAVLRILNPGSLWLSTTGRCSKIWQLAALMPAIWPEQ